jgi:FkbH-like protein
MTTRRYSEKDIEGFMQKAWVFDATIADKFGDYGLTAVAIVVAKGDVAEVDSFLMSCRILGRRIEFRFFDAIVNQLKKQKIEKLHATFIKTAKNQPAENFYKDFGFSKIDDIYELDLTKYNSDNNPKVNQAISINNLNFQWTN